MKSINLFLIFIFTFLINVNCFSDNLYREKTYNYIDKVITCMDMKQPGKVYKDGYFDWSDMTDITTVVKNNNKFNSYKIKNFSIDYYKINNDFQNLRFYPLNRIEKPTDKYYFVTVNDKGKMIWNGLNFGKDFRIYDIVKVDDNNYIICFDYLGRITVNYIHLDNKLIIKEYYLPIVDMFKAVQSGIPNPNDAIKDIKFISDNIVLIKYPNMEEYWLIKNRDEDYNYYRDLKLDFKPENRLIWTNNNNHKHNNYKSVYFIDSEIEPSYENIKDVFPFDVIFK